jgi:hypothetical protein
MTYFLSEKERQTLVEALNTCRVFAVPTGREISPKRVTEALSLLASLEKVEPVGWVTSLEWKPRQSEQVQKLTREAQPQYGYVAPLYTLPTKAKEESK